SSAQYSRSLHDALPISGMFVEDHDYTIDEDGNIEKVRHIENSTFDRLHTKENWRSGIDDKGIDVQDQNILFSLSEDDQNYTINRSEEHTSELQSRFDLV